MIAEQYPTEQTTSVARDWWSIAKRVSLGPVMIVTAVIGCCDAEVSLAGPFAPAAGVIGSDAIPHGDAAFLGWATDVVNLERGPQDLSNPLSPLASHGVPQQALGPAGLDTLGVVSLGDGGSITLGFASPLRDGPGADFAVFENSFSDQFLELAFVEVSSNGTHFARFPAVSLTPTTTQLGGFGLIDPTDISQLAGKYRVGFGTPFDLQVLQNADPFVDIEQIRYVRLVDVVGSIDGAYARYDSEGRTINDPWRTPFPSAGFDVDGVGVVHFVESSWNFPTSGSWHVASHWSNDDRPGASDRVAVLDASSLVSPDDTIHVAVETPVTVRGIYLEGEASRFVVDGAESVTLASYASQVAAEIRIASGEHSILAPLRLDSPTELNVAAEASLTLGAWDLQGNSIVSAGFGSLIFDGPSSLSLPGATGMLTVLSGQIGGNGTIRAHIQLNGGIVSPGSSSGSPLMASSAVLLPAHGSPAGVPVLGVPEPHGASLMAVASWILGVLRALAVNRRADTGPASHRPPGSASQFGIDHSQTRARPVHACSFATRLHAILC